MDVMPSRPEIFLLTDSDRQLVTGGPALAGPDGSSPTSSPSTPA